MPIEQARALLEPAATRVRDPITGRSIWLADMIRDPSLAGDALSFVLVLGADHTSDDGQRIEQALVRNLQVMGFTGEVRCTIRTARVPTSPGKQPIRGMSGPGMQPHGGPFVKKPIEDVAHVIAVASGKGGVGKSTVSTNLAVGLTAAGYKVGLLDADVYGPSLPTMMKVRGRPLAGADKRIIPLESYGVQCISMGFLVPEDEAIIWRGPMVMGAVRQFLHQVAWSALDFLIIDLPPGTGDAQLTMIQTTPLSGAIVVTTPQEVAVIDAVRAIEMFRKLDVPVLGVIENMAWMTLPDGSRMHPFGSGGGMRIAEKYDVPLLGQVPFDETICAGGDAGVPVATESGDSARIFQTLARTVGSGLVKG